MFPCELPAKPFGRHPAFGSGPYLFPPRVPGVRHRTGSCRQSGPKAVRDSASFPQKKSRPQAALVDYFSSNEWITTPDRSLGSNHVVFGGMMLPVSAMLISCCIETG